MKQFVLSSARWCPKALRPVFIAFALAGWSLTASAQIPQIVTEPQSVSVASGQTATFEVEVSGGLPRTYRWQQNGTNFVGGTNQNLTITNVQFRHYGDYALIVSNSFGVVTSQVAELRVDEHLTFRIVSLMTNGVIAVEGSSLIGDDKGGMAVSSNNVFVTGGSGAGDQARTGRFPIDTLTGGASLTTGFDALTGNLRTETVYSLGNGTTPIQFISSSATHTNATSLLELDGNTGTLTANRITLSTNIPLPANQEGNIGLFAGYDRIVIHNGVRVYNIDLPSGKVTDLGAMSSISHNNAESALAYWGIAEYWRGALYVVCVQNSTVISRTRVPDRVTTPILTLPSFPQYFGSMASIGFSISRSRWYGHVEGTSFFRQNADETVGSAKASFTQDAGYPMITRDLTDLVSYPSSNVVFSVNVSGGAPFTYQWFFNNEPMDGAHGPTLTLADIDETDEGFYRVEVANSVGSVSSRQAYLTIYSVPEIVANPLSRSVFPGSNVTFSVTVNAAPPVSYQWRFNNAIIPNGTNRILVLTNVQPSAKGLYYVEVVNRFGVLSSEEAELNVVVPVDDGTVFRITNLGSNGMRVVETYNSLGFNYQYGPFAVGRSNVFYSTFGDTAYSDAQNLAITGFAGGFYGAMLSNLRSEKVYALAEDRVIMEFTGGSATELVEIDSTTGTLTTNMIRLSSAVPIGSINSLIGFFSGYGRAIILNGSRAYEILLPSGQVTDLGPMNTPQHAFSFSGAFWGIVERQGGVNYLVYARNNQQIVRTRVPDGLETVLAQFQNLSSYMSSISVSIPRNRWYFQHLFSSQFTNGNSVMGYGPASFVLGTGGQADHLAFDPISALQLANQPFPITIRALNSSNELATNFTGIVTLQGLATNGAVVGVSPSAVSNFVGGVWTGSITILQPSAAMFLRAFDRDENQGTSDIFSANPTNDIIVRMSDSPDPVVLGQLVNYTILITNTGPRIATSVVLTNVVPTNLQFVAHQTSRGACINAGTLVRCTIGDVAIGDAVQVVITARAATLGNVTNTVRVGRGEVDPTPANNTASEVTLVSLPMARVGDISVLEGDSGTNDAQVPVILSAPWTNTVSVNYTTSGGSAISIPPNHDFVSRFGLLVFPPGSTTQYVVVPIRGEPFYESNEVFFVNISVPTNVVIADTQGACTILNDDIPPLVSVEDTALLEGNSGTFNALFRVKLTAGAGVPVSVLCATGDGTAMAGHDYVPRSQLLTFPANTTTLTQNFSVQVIGETKIEPNEYFYVNLVTATNAFISRTQALCTITNNDGAMLLHTFQWSAIPPAVETNTPLAVTIMAKDVFGTTITNFTNSVTISGGVPLTRETGQLLGDVQPAGSFSGTAYTLGYYFVPETNITVTHVRSYYGVKVTIWGADGTVLATQPVPNYDGTWVTTALDTPINLSAGSSNLITIYGDTTDSHYSTLTLSPTFSHGVFGPSGWVEGDAYPLNTYTGERFLVDLIYAVGPATTLVPVVPTNTANFVGGIWSGNISIMRPASGMQLFAEDAQRRVGASNPFQAGIYGPQDNDKDGMWDDWEMVYLFSPNDPSDADADPDGDGHTNRDEFELGSDPLNPASALRIQAIVLSGNEVRIKFFGVLPGNRYRLETRDGSDAWTPVGELEIGDYPDAEFVQPLSDPGASRFYRIRFLRP